MHFFRYRVFFLTLVLSLSTPLWFARAAVVSVSVSDSSISLQARTTFTAILDTEGESVNAIEGALRLPSQLVCDHVSSNNSIINLWVTRPTIDKGRVIFSGATPGGFNGSHNELFSLSCLGSVAGNVVLSFENISVLSNDGQGSLVSTSTKDTTILIRSTLATVSEVVDKDIILKKETNDKIPPETFTPSISIYPGAFDNKHFLTFVTQDKESGVSYYEVAEQYNFGGDYSGLLWHRTESPYVLDDQRLTSTIFVKAVDGAGNQQIVSIPPVHKNVFLYYGRYGAIALGVILVILGVVFSARIYHKNRYTKK